MSTELTAPDVDLLDPAVVADRTASWVVPCAMLPWSCGVPGIGSGRSPATTPRATPCAGTRTPAARRVVIDCSADGDVAARAGAATAFGRDSDGLVQPMTLFFRVSGIDDEEVERYVRAHPDDFRPFASIVAEARAAGRFPAPRMGVGMYKTLRPCVWRINTTRILGKDGTRSADLTAAEIEGREQVLKLIDFFRAELPGFRHCELLDSAATVGVRETRWVIGEYDLTLEDLQTGRHFDDVLAPPAARLDAAHPATGRGGPGPGLAAGRRTARRGPLHVLPRSPEAGAGGGPVSAPGLPVRVRREVCIGAGFCVAEGPEIFRFDDDGLAEVRPDAGSLPEERLRDMESGCPASAIDVGVARDQ